MEVFLSLAQSTNTVWRLHNPSESCVAVLKILPYIHSRKTEDHRTDEKVLKTVKRNTITLTAEISTATLKTGGNGWNDDFNVFRKKICQVRIQDSARDYKKSKWHHSYQEIYRISSSEIKGTLGTRSKKLPVKHMRGMWTHLHTLGPYELRTQ